VARTIGLQTSKELVMISLVLSKESGNRKADGFRALRKNPMSPFRNYVVVPATSHILQYDSDILSENANIGKVQRIMLRVSR
jgi:hypothetical protein